MKPARILRPANYLIALIIVGLYLASVYFFPTDERRGTREQSVVQVPRVYVEEAVQTLFEESFESIGKIEGWREVTLTSEIRGRTREVRVEVGDSVAEGQLLLQLDDREQHIGLREKEANLEKGLAKLRNTEWGHKRKEKLYREMLLSEEDLQMATYELQVAQAEHLAAQASLDRATYNLENTRIKAPFAGTIVERFVEKGQTIDLITPLFTLVDLRWVSVSVGLTDQELARVSLNQRVELRTGLYPTVIAGTIYAIAEKSDEITNTYQIKVKVENSSEHALLSGMVARVKFPWRVLEDTVVVPEAAVLRDGPDEYLFIVEDGRARRVQIAPIASRNGMVAVDANLTPGDKVVTLGHTGLSDGSEVVVEEREGDAEAAQSSDSQ